MKITHNTEKDESVIKAEGYTLLRDPEHKNAHLTLINGVPQSWSGGILYDNKGNLYNIEEDSFNCSRCGKHHHTCKVCGHTTDPCAVVQTMEVRTKIRSRIENYENMQRRTKTDAFAKEINELRWVIMIMDNQD